MKYLLLTTIAAVVLVGCGMADRALIQAARTGNHEAVKQHLASGADVNATDMIGRTPLHYAATKEITELLIANGADVNAKDDVFDVDPLGKRAGCKVLEKEFASFREKVEGRPA